MRNDDAAHPGKYGFIIMNNQDHKRKPQIWGSATSTGQSNRPSVSQSGCRRPPPHLVVGG